LAVVPLSQHLGRPARALVKKKDKVLRGQRIGEAEGFISAHVHSPVSGKVKDVALMRGGLGTHVACVVITSDGKDEAAEAAGADWEALSAGEIRDRVKEAGVVGMGGATFPTHVKLSPPEGKTITELVLNGCECEPYLTADHRVMLERTADVVLGTRILQKALGVTRAFIALEDNKSDAGKALREAAAGTGVEVAELHVKYPQGAEKQLIRALFDREVPSGGLPMDVGVVVQNVGTAVAVKEAVVDGRPLTERILTVSGAAAAGPKNLLVRVGTSFREVVAFAGGTKTTVHKIISGGPMMGFAQPTLDVPVTKGTSGILLFTEAEARIFRTYPCLRCGRCFDVCPMKLRPALLSQTAEAGRWEDLESLDVFDCIECGCCAWECPAHRRIVQNVRRGKAEVGKLIRKRKEQEEKKSV
jgi:electron transport complex protein RnfC